MTVPSGIDFDGHGINNLGCPIRPLLPAAGMIE